MRLAGEGATLALGRALGERLRPGDVVTLAGPLGSGKTTLARGALAALGYRGEVASPSFPILLPYAPPALRLPVAHADLFRIEQDGELDELGLDEWLADGALLVEWPERLPTHFTCDALALRLTTEADGARALTWAAGPAWKGRWPPHPI